ncbi:MAG: hypothetical protein WC592_04095 [Candidatus Omnitrophota bacterium]|nr:hypothetical protein [Candidatus Omnitrophota bacterium]
MSHEEHIIHQLKEMHSSLAHTDRQVSNVRWLLYINIAIMISAVLIILMKQS